MMPPPPPSLLFLLCKIKLIIYLQNQQFIYFNPPPHFQTGMGFKTGELNIQLPLIYFLKVKTGFFVTLKKKKKQLLSYRINCFTISIEQLFSYLFPILCTQWWQCVCVACDRSWVQSRASPNNQIYFIILKQKFEDVADRQII